MKVMGLIKGEVKLEQYDLKWEEDFQAEAGKLYNLFGDVAQDIQHIGSTSVRGLSAKPIIDIAVGVKSLTDFAKVRQKFVDAPEYSIKEDGDPMEILVRKHNPENQDEITHYNHKMEIEGDRNKDSILFRDTLRSNPKMRLEYESLKRDLAKQYPNDRAAYTQSKDYFIRSMLREAKGKKAPHSHADEYRTIGLFIGIIIAEAMYLFITVPTVINRFTAEGGFKFRATDAPDTLVANMIFIAPFALIPLIGGVLLMKASLKSHMMWIFWIAMIIFLTTPVLALLT